MLTDVLLVIGLTILPLFELRASIPFGILATTLPWPTVLFLAIVANIALIPLVYLFITYGLELVRKIGIVDRLYHKVVERAQRKVHPYIEKYGIIGLALFVGVPIPGSGVYAGTLGAYLLGFKFKQLFIAATIGVIIAGVIVTVATLSGASVVEWIIKEV